MINQVSDFLAPQLVSNFGIALFVFFAIVSGIAQYFILQYAKRKIGYMYSRSRSTRFLYKVVYLVQYFLVAIVFVLGCSDSYFVKLFHLPSSGFHGSKLWHLIFL